MKKQNYQIYALITIFFWSMAFIFTRMTLPYFSASSLGFLRYLIASAALIVIVLVTKMKPPQLKDCPLFLLSGAIGFFLYMITFNQGLVSVPAATASVVNATVPAVTALIAGVVYKEKIRKVQWIAILIELVGVAVLTVMSGGLSAGKGLLWMFGAALSLSTYNILQRKLTQTYTALQASTFSIFFGTLLLAIFAPTAMRELAAAPPIQYAYVAFFGNFPERDRLCVVVGGICKGGAHLAGQQFYGAGAVLYKHSWNPDTWRGFKPGNLVRRRHHPCGRAFVQSRVTVRNVPIRKFFA